MMDDHFGGIYIFQQKSATLVEIEDAVSTFSSGSRLHCDGGLYGGNPCGVLQTSSLDISHAVIQTQFAYALSNALYMFLSVL